VFITNEFPGTAIDVPIVPPVPTDTLSTVRLPFLGPSPASVKVNPINLFIVLTPAGNWGIGPVGYTSFHTCN
jgi:hypothetical protein